MSSEFSRITPTHVHAADALNPYSTAVGCSAHANADSTLIVKAGSKRVVTTGANKIVLSALDGLNTVWTVSGASPGFFVQPIRADGTARPLKYNPTTGEITYEPARRRELEVDVETRIAELEGQVKALAEMVQALLP